LSGFGRSGVSICTDPIFEPAGQLGWVSPPSAIWSGPQEPSPPAEDGSTATPSGRVTTASRSSADEIPSGSSFCGRVRVTSRPVGESAWVVVGCASKEASNGTRSQPVKMKGLPSESWS